MGVTGRDIAKGVTNRLDKRYIAMDSSLSVVDFLISDDTIVQVSATVILGVLILISVAQSMKVRSVHKRFTGGILTRMIALVIVPFVVSSIAAILGLSQYANWILIASFLLLLAFLFYLTLFVRFIDRLELEELEERSGEKVR